MCGHVQDRSDGPMETRLFMRQANPSSFRTYTLYAENGVAVTTADITLTESRRDFFLFSNYIRQSIVIGHVRLHAGSKLMSANSTHVVNLCNRKCSSG